tara:strand:+ start:2178 stop:2864 length:687 start_codon:yes stop_codon:yes gene_type:complete
MKYKGFLLDLDDTLYDYDFCHSHALTKTLKHISDKFQTTNIDLQVLYYDSRKKININLVNTASSHSRLLYFQYLLEKLNISVADNLEDIHDFYWDCYFQKLALFDGVKDFLKIYGDKVCILTDFTLKVQLKKIRHLGIGKLIRFIVSSEEIGVEKPDKKMFINAINKLGCSIDDVCMIGDNFDKDIKGASEVGIDSIWLNRKGQNINIGNHNFTFREIKNFNEIFKII